MKHDDSEKDIPIEWKDPLEAHKYVCEGAKVQCMFCASPGTLKATSTKIKLQDKPFITAGDKDGKVNFNFQGPCMHPSQQKPNAPPPPCKSIISLGEWMNTSKTFIGNERALVAGSTINCSISGAPVRIIHSGQMATLNNLTKMDSPALGMPSKEKEQEDKLVEISRKAYYIHGTISESDRWNMFPSTVQQLNRIAFGMGMDKNDTEGLNEIVSEEFKKKHCDFFFQWGNNGIISPGNNWLLNSVEDRRIACEKLIKHIKGNIGKCNEIVLIGHSHGGNVAIQAADRIFTEIPAIKQVFVLTVGTPAYNRPFITSFYNNRNLTTINEGMYPDIPYLGKEYLVPAMKLGRKLWGPVGMFLYVNCENPANWKNKDKISHIALWNKKDYVDNIAWAWDINKYNPYHAMTLANTNRFTNPTTVNVEFNFDPKETRSNYERKMKPFAEWLAKLDYLRNCMLNLRRKDYLLPTMPQLLTYEEYLSRHNEMILSERTDQFIVNQPDALRVYVTEPEPRMKEQGLSAQLREKADSLQELFLNMNAFYQFMRDIDSSQKKVITFPDKQKEMDIMDMLYLKHPEIQAIEAIKQEMYSKTEFLELANAIYLLDNTSLGKHGFDLANPKMIEEAINDGRIKPFPRAHKTDKTKE